MVRINDQSAEVILFHFDFCYSVIIVSLRQSQWAFCDFKLMVKTRDYNFSSVYCIFITQKSWFIFRSSSDASIYVSGLNVS